MERYEETFPISADLVDQKGLLKLSALLTLSQEAAGSHCEKLGLPWQLLWEKGLFWAILRNRVQITRLPGLGETIHLTTWPLPTTRTAYPRALEARDAAGKLLFQVHSLWVLMDTDHRSLVLPGKSGVAVPGSTTGTELPAPQGLHPLLSEAVKTRQVAPGDLDTNRHMNNARYLDWVIDACPEAREGTPKQLSLCYLAEARLADVLQLHSQKLEDALQVDIYRDDTRIFAVKMEY